MIYFKLNSDDSVTLAGTIPIDGYLPYDGAIPNSQFLKWDSATSAIIIDDEKVAIDEGLKSKALLDGFTKLTENTLQNEIDSYNADNNVLFRDIHAVANYINTPTYTHYNWCVLVWDWNVNVWETARQIQLDVMAGNREIPTEEQFLSELPKLVIP